MFIVWKAGILLQDDLTIETTRHFFFRQDVFPIKQWQNVVLDSSSELEGSLWNDCDETAFHHVADPLGTPVLDLTGKYILFKEDGGCGE